MTIIVPVRDNASGVARLVGWWERALGARARELLFVDDGSVEPVIALGNGMRVVRSPGKGPAYARNLGWRSCSSTWCAFIDSDCVPAPGWPEAFSEGWRGEIALQGAVRALGRDAISRFYDSQATLAPMLWTADGRPRYLITANALVLRSALEQVGGFDERFPIAGGEDVELGLRLAEAGALRFCSDAVVAHDFEPSIRRLAQRFFRYGRGNRMLSLARASDSSSFRPRLFLPRRMSVLNLGLAVVAYVALLAGWMAEGSGAHEPTRSAALPPATR